MNKHELTNACYFLLKDDRRNIKKNRWILIFLSSFILHDDDHLLSQLRLWLKHTYTWWIRGGDHQFPPLYICIFASLIRDEFFMIRCFTLATFIIRNYLNVIYFKSRLFRISFLFLFVSIDVHQFDIKKHHISLNIKDRLHWF